MQDFVVEVEVLVTVAFVTNGLLMSFKLPISYILLLIDQSVNHMFNLLFCKQLKNTVLFNPSNC